MKFLGKAGHTAQAQGRRARRSGSRPRLGVARAVPRPILWTVPLVVATVVAASLWALIRPSDLAAHPVGGAMGSPAVAGTPHLQGTVVSLTFNFGTVSQYNFARPLLRQYGMNGTFYVTPERVDAGDACCVSRQLTQQLYREGDEIGSFSVDGLDLTVPSSTDPAQDYAYKKQEICGARERLAYFALDPRSFAY